MKISYIKNNHTVHTTYKAGMNRAVKNQISAINCVNTEKFLIKNGIYADFANNKTVAWSVIKVFDILLKLQKDIGIKFNFPLSITVDNLKNFQRASKGDNIIGFVNFLPCKLKSNSDEVTPPMSIIFNKNFSWEDIDGISDERYINKLEVSKHFLSPFIHEFGHIIHEGNIIDKYKIDDIHEKINTLFDSTLTEQYKQMYGKMVSKKLCEYASTNMLELIACDISKRFLDCLDTNLCINKNSFKMSPYNKYYWLKTLFKNKNPYDMLVSNVYNCKKNILG